MSKENGGLFSRMVKFVRNPQTNWAELDQGESEKDSAYSKTNLKEMIERKRRNDFVRKREFDMLRKIRQREATGASMDGSQRPSFFQSSMPSKPDDRAQTLKKIDEIEAQMSMQWWKTNVPNSTLNAGSVPPAKPPVQNALQPGTVRMPAAGTAPVPAPATVARQAYDQTEPAALQTDDDMSLDFTTDPAVAPLQRAAPVAAPTATPASAAPPAPAPASDTVGFSASKLFALDVEEVAHDAEHEEAAIRFANGDDAAAEAALSDALTPGGTHHSHEETWLTLFDFYRAIGNHDAFETRGIDFAAKFGKSAPAWFSMPEAVAKKQGKAPEAESVVEKAHWTSPSVLGAQSVAALKATLGRTPAPWRIDWSKLKSIDAAAFEPLAAMFTSWCGQAVRLEFMGARQLDEVLKNATPSGAREVPPSAWTLRMEVLRVTHRPDEFELAALDYCVTYEVSPPSWVPVECTYKTLDPDSLFGGSTIIGDAFKDSMAAGAASDFSHSQIAPGAFSQQVHHLAAIELAGQIQGDATHALEKLEAKLFGADLMSIDCANLIRVDFSAAGTLLNWVSARQAEGRMVQFTDVHRLVASFFHVIGISEHARVAVRRN